MNTNLKPQDKDLESCRLKASDKSDLIRKVYFLLKSGLHVTAFFILLEAGYLATTIVVNFIYKLSTTIIFGTLKNNV